MTPAWAMNPLMWPTFPPTRIVPPFSEIPARDDASPSTTIVPPRLDAPAHSETLPLDPDRSGLQVLADRPAGEAVHHHVGPVVEAADEVPGVALDVDPHPVAQADRQVMAAPGLEHPGGRAVGERGQRGVDLAGGQLRAAQDHRVHT